MSQSEWFPSKPAGRNTADQQMTFITMSTVDDLSYTPSEEQKSRDRAQIKATGRRSWKTLKGKAEAVWSPELEAVLIQALEQYQLTDDHKPTTSKHGIRFPYRNRFISQYIYEQTGKTRTHKQVGSRLQQLRDTCEDNRILALISRGSCQDADDDHCKGEPEQSPSPDRRDDSPSPFRDEGEPQGNTLVVYTQITAQPTHSPYEIPRIEFLVNDISNPLTIPLCPLAPSQSVHHRSSPSSTLSMFSSAVQLYSSWPLSQETNFVIYKDERAVRQERAHLRQISRPSEVDKGWTYECDLAGPSWTTICETQNPSRITILQSLVPAVTPSSLAMLSPARKVSIVYHFELSEHTALSGLPRPVANVMSGYGQPSGSHGPSGTPSTYLQSSSTWDAHAYQGRDPGYNLGLHSSQESHLPHPSHSYPPSMGLPTQHYVLDNNPGMMSRSHSDSSADHSEYDVGHGHGSSYYEQPRMGPWSTDQMQSTSGPTYAATGRRATGYALNSGYAC